MNELDTWIHQCHIRDEVIKYYRDESMRTKEKLKKLEPILELYANSYFGVPQQDGTYRMLLTSPNMIGECYATYDPRPAREGLSIIRETIKEVAKENSSSNNNNKNDLTDAIMAIIIILVLAVIGNAIIRLL